MAGPKILVFAGSLRTGSFNETLAAHATSKLTELGAEVTHVSLRDYPMPIYDGDLEAREGVPERAQAFALLISQHQGVFIAGPEYNAGITPLMKNTIDWVSRVDRGSAYKNRIFALGAASDGPRGGYRSLIHTRHVLELGCAAMVQPEMVAISGASKAYDENGQLIGPTAKVAANTFSALVANAKRYAT
jgi:NAD(P)H-dependent FMN reductase